MEALFQMGLAPAGYSNYGTLAPGAFVTPPLTPAELDAYFVSNQALADRNYGGDMRKMWAAKIASMRKIVTNDKYRKYVITHRSADVGRIMADVKVIRPDIYKKNEAINPQLAIEAQRQAEAVALDAELAAMQQALQQAQAGHSTTATTTATQATPSPSAGMETAQASSGETPSFNQIKESIDAKYVFMVLGGLITMYLITKFLDI